MSTAYSIVRKRNLTTRRVKKTAQAWKIIPFAGINTDADVSGKRGKMDIQATGEKTDLLDVQRSMERFGNDKEAFIQIMRSFTASNRSLLPIVKDATEDNMAKYAITVHGIKGSSRSVCADKVGDMAEALEKAAKSGDFDFIRANNPDFVKTVEELIKYIDDLTDNMSSANSKPVKEKPDMETLSALLAACKSYDMDGVDAAMEKMESFEYKSGGELAAWLRTNVDHMNFKEIEEKLSALMEGENGNQA